MFHLQPVASTINTLAGALYKVFCSSSDQAKKEMRQACFDYLSLGGFFSNGPVSLLSGLNPRPLSLVCHFFAVAIYGVGRLLLPFPSPKRLWIGARLISVRICLFYCYPWLNAGNGYILTFMFTSADCLGNYFPHHQGWRSKTNVFPCNYSCIL